MKTIRGPAVFVTQLAGGGAHLQHLMTESVFDDVAADGDTPVALRTLGVA